MEKEIPLRSAQILVLLTGYAIHYLEERRAGLRVIERVFRLQRYRVGTESGIIKTACSAQFWY